MSDFQHRLARIAVWNLAGFNQCNSAAGIPPDSDRAQKQAKGLALLDAELVTLVEASPLSHIGRWSWDVKLLRTRSRTIYRLWLASVFSKAG